MILNRPAVKFVAFVVILILCVLAQIALLAKDPLGYLFLGAAGIVALIAIAPVPRARVEEALSLEAARGLRLILGLIALIIGLGVIVYSAYTFHTELLVQSSPDELAWTLYGIGLFLSLLGGLLIVGIGRLPRLDLTMWIALAVLALAVFVRVYQVDQYPFGVWFDEAAYGLHVRHWLTEPTFRPVFSDNITFPHLILDVLALQIFGTANVAGLRVISALLGSAGVILAYLVGRELRGRWFGLLMAFLLAALRWSIDFSRIGMIGAELVTLSLLTIYTVIRLIRYGRLRDALWFGIALTLGLYGYSPYQLQLIPITLYFLITYPFLRRAKLRTLVLGITAVVAAVIIVIPLGLYVIDRSDEYFNRVNQVSIFNENRPPEVTLTDAILGSTVKHLEMFHLSGDNNGRHNLPGAPELDPVTGALLILGLFIALREHRREHLLFFLSLAISLLGGILSVAFEAPQSLRSIGAIIGVIYFGALGLEGMSRLAASWLTPLLRHDNSTAYRLAGAGALGALGVMAAWNFNIYFNLQRTNLAVWSAYSTADTLTGRSYASYPDNTLFFISPLIGNSEPVQFLAPDQIARSNQLIMPDPFPLRIEPAPAVIMLIPYENFYMDYLHKLYPNATFQPIRPVDYGVDDSPDKVFFTTIKLTADDVGAIEGLRDGQGVLYAPLYDSYTFTFAPGVQLNIDNQSVASGTPIQLEEGNHKIAVTPPDAILNWQYSQSQNARPVPSQYFFHDPVTPNGLVATFYKSPDWTGDPVVKRIYPFVYWLIQIIPMDRPYSVRYDGYLYVPVTGEYQFAMNAIDTAAFDIDGKNVVTTTTPNMNTFATVTLTQGWHPVEARHQDLTSATRVFLSWKIPGADSVIPITRDYFCPTTDRCAIPLSTSANP